MPETEEITIKLPTGLVTNVRERIAAGEFSDMSDLVQQSLSTFLLGDGQAFGMTDADFDELLRKEVLPVHELMQADPSRGRTIEQVRERLAREHAEFRKAG